MPYLCPWAVSAIPKDKQQDAESAGDRAPGRSCHTHPDSYPSCILLQILHAQDSSFLDLCPGNKQSRSVLPFLMERLWGSVLRALSRAALARLLLPLPIHPDSKATASHLSLQFSSVTARTSFFFLSKHILLSVPRRGSLQQSVYNARTEAVQAGHRGLL